MKHTGKGLNLLKYLAYKTKDHKNQLNDLGYRQEMDQVR